MIAVHGRGWHAIPGILQALGVDIGERGDLDVGITPMRTRSFAPSTPADDDAEAEASVLARPVAIAPINLRRESI
jgi:hypothetical protein